MQASASRLARPRDALPLGLTVGLHLLLVLAWLMRPMPSRQREDAGLVSVMIPVLVPAPAPRAPRQRIVRAARPARATNGPPAAAPAPASAAPASVAPEPEPERQAPAAEPFAGAAPAPPSLSGDSELLGRSKRAAGGIDRALRGGKSEVPMEPDTPWARFRRGLEAAHVEPLLSEIRDSYTAPDGIVIYRARQGGRETCRQTGSVNFLPGGASGAGLAGNVPCPKGVKWARY
jgi:hypothetical protein